MEVGGEGGNAEVLKALGEFGAGVEEFKAKHAREVADLKDRLRAIEAKGNRPGAGIETETASGDWSQTAASTGWVDQKGSPVRVLKPGDLWAGRKAEGIALGDAVCAMISGPRNEFEAKALAEGTTTAGGFTVPTPLATWYIDRLRAQSVAIRAGARTVPMDSSTLAIARLETDPTIGWRAENAGIAEGDPTFGRVLLTAKSLAGIVKFSRELLADTVNAGAMIEQALLQTMALELDRAAIFGDGSNNSPTGIINTAGINEVQMAGNGAQLTNYDKLIDTLYELALNNVQNVSAGIMHPRTEASLAKLKDSQNNPLTVPEMVARVPRLSTTAAPITETQGTSNDCSSIIYGDFSHLLIGMREEINIRVLSEAFASNGQVAVLVHCRADVALARAASFSRLKGIKP